MLNWANQFNICCFLDTHQYPSSQHRFECLLAAGSLHSLSAPAGTALLQLEQFQQAHHDWLFGHLAYDLKNEIERLQSTHKDGIGLPDLFFFVPEFVVQAAPGELRIGSCNEDHRQVWEAITRLAVEPDRPALKPITVHQRFAREEYLQAVERLKEHIHRGDCYEINFCQEFFAENALIDPLGLFGRLSHDSPNPFSAFYKVNETYLLCLSPERYLKKTGTQIISQPIKGTSRRLPDPEADRRNIDRLKASEKERAENIMVVDLVRNDLSKVCIQGTVQVDELCEVYSFPQVHQLISTVSGRLRPDASWTEIIRASFPMGSMTGAPKKKVMELIEQYERTRRGLFSGSVGYITPALDFDLNVVIRSLLYNASSRYLSFQTGSAITFNSDADTEYEECLLKASAIKKALAETNTFH